MSRAYHVNMPKEGFRDWKSFTTDERAKLRPIAETLALLDSNGFFINGMRDDGTPFIDVYLPEAYALYEANGGDSGWAGLASFARPHVKALA